MSQHFDFDAFWGEKEEIGKSFKAFGKTYELPSAVPASIIVDVVALNKKGANNVGEEVIIKMAQSLLGDKAFKDLLKKNISIDQLEALLENIMSLYTDGKLDKKGSNPSK